MLMRKTIEVTARLDIVEIRMIRYKTNEQKKCANEESHKNEN